MIDNDRGQTLVNKYVWVIETIYRRRKISFKQLNELWLRDDISRGVDIPKRRVVSTRNVTIDWFYRDGLPEEALIIKNTETGTIRISNPLLTAADLVQYQQHVGGLSRVASILEELSEHIDIRNQYAPLVTHVKKVVWQRLGYIFEKIIEEKELADELFEQLRASSGYFKYQPLSTSSDDNTSNRDSRWKININVQIELEGRIEEKSG